MSRQGMTGSDKAFARQHHPLLAPHRLERLAGDEGANKANALVTRDAEDEGQRGMTCVKSESTRLAGHENVRPPSWASRASRETQALPLL